jgi:hypothetical protein
LTILDRYVIIIVETGKKKPRWQKQTGQTKGVNEMKIVHYTEDNGKFEEGESLQKVEGHSSTDFNEIFFCYLYNDKLWESNPYPERSMIILEVPEEVVEFEQPYPGEEPEFEGLLDEYIIKSENFNKVKVVEIF